MLIPKQVTLPLQHDAAKQEVLTLQCREHAALQKITSSCTGADCQPISTSIYQVHRRPDNHCDNAGVTAVPCSLSGWYAALKRLVASWTAAFTPAGSKLRASKHRAAMSVSSWNSNGTRCDSCPIAW